MKNLYERLDLSPDVSERMIRKRLGEIDDEDLKQAAQEILLHSGRREVYDRNYRLLKLVGELRASLNLNEAPNWQEGSASKDFGVASEKQPPQKSWWDRRSEQPDPASYGSSSASAGDGEGVGKKVAAGAGKVAYAIGSRILGFVIIISLCGVVSVVADLLSGTDSSESSEQEPETVEAPPDEELRLDDRNQEELRVGDKNQNGDPSFSVPRKPLPDNGTWWNYTSERRIAPLQISVSSDEHYYIKVLDAYTEEQVLALFIRSGRTARVDVPVGTYRLRYAVGGTWYGQEHRFGPETKYFKAEDTFTFEVEGQRVKGHKIELILQTGGNLSTDRITEGEF